VNFDDEEAFCREIWFENVVDLPCHVATSTYLNLHIFWCYELRGISAYSWGSTSSNEKRRRGPDGEFMSWRKIECPRETSPYGRTPPQTPFTPPRGNNAPSA
jgi:hypothetical protein